MNIQITISEGMDVEISFQKTHILLPLTLIGTIPTYYIQQVHYYTGGLKPYGKKNHHMIRTKVWEPKKLTAYSSSYSAIHNRRVDTIYLPTYLCVYVCVCVKIPHFLLTIIILLLYSSILYEPPSK